MEADLVTVTFLFFSFFFAASITSYVVIAGMVFADETLFFTLCDPPSSPSSPQAGSEEGEM